MFHHNCTRWLGPSLSFDFRSFKEWNCYHWSKLRLKVVSSKRLKHPQWHKERIRFLIFPIWEDTGVLGLFLASQKLKLRSNFLWGVLCPLNLPRKSCNSETELKMPRKWSFLCTMLPSRSGHPCVADILRSSRSKRNWFYFNESKASERVSSQLFDIPNHEMYGFIFIIRCTERKPCLPQCRECFI